eukprot:8355125-Lingulodinium_polyedra.AAC.1
MEDWERAVFTAVAVCVVICFSLPARPFGSAQSGPSQRRFGRAQGGPFGGPAPPTTGGREEKQKPAGPMPDPNASAAG